MSLKKPSPNPNVPTSIRAEYERHGAESYYAQFGTAYRNPHESIIASSLTTAAVQWGLDLGHVLDLAAGTGEVTAALNALGARGVDGIDPYTADAYQQRIGVAAERFTFADIAQGALDGRRYSLVACSFALHLCEKSQLPAVMYQLAQVTDTLLILTPHKKPLIQPRWGWKLLHEALVQRVRTRMYRKIGA